MTTNQKLSEEQLIVFRKQSFRKRIILGVMLVSILAPILVGINSEVRQGGIEVSVILSILAIGIFGAIWFVGYRNHSKFLKELPNETISMIEGQLEKAEGLYDSTMFQIDGIKYYSDSRFGKFAIKGTRVRLFMTDKSKTIFHVEFA